MPGILDFLGALLGGQQPQQGMLAQPQGAMPQSLQPQGIMPPNFLQNISKALIAQGQPSMYKQGTGMGLLGALNAGLSGDPSQIEQQSMLSRPGYAKIAATQQQPNAVQEYQYYNNLSPAEKENYLRVKRASQLVDLGGTQNVLNPTGPGLSQTFNKTLKPEDMPVNAAAKAEAVKTGENTADNKNQIAATGDIVGLYNKLQQDAQTAPSGALESGKASVANLLNKPTEGSKAQGTFDADLNNLYLATIRSLKGTGRVMEQELNKIADAAPKPTDSKEVKIAKAQAHMQYYQNRMKELGFDPNTGQAGGQPPTPATQSGVIDSSEYFK